MHAVLIIITSGASEVALVCCGNISG